MPPNPAKADAVEVTLDTYTQHCNDLTNNPQASAKDIREKRTQFLDQLGIDVGRPFNPSGNSKKSTWESNLLQSLLRHAPAQYEAVIELNDRFKDLPKLRGEQNVAQTVKTYTGWLDDNAQASASAEQIEAKKTELLNQLSTDIGSKPQSRSHLLSGKQGVGIHAPAQLEAAKALDKRFRTALAGDRRAPEQFQGSIQAAVPPPPQTREEDFAAMVRRRTAQARKADPSQHQEPPGASSSQEIHAPMPVRQSQLPTINSADEQNSETSEQITYLSQAKNGLKQLVDAIVNRDDANRDRLWRQFTVKSGLQFNVAHVKTVIENALKRVRDFPATTTGQYQALQEIQIGLTASNNKLQEVINLHSSRRAQTPHLSQGTPAQERVQSLSSRSQSTTPALRGVTPAELTRRCLQSQPPNQGHSPSHRYNHRS